MPNADFKEMIQLANYIDWSLRSGINLNFTLTEEELKFVEIAIESQLYLEMGIYPDQTFLPVWELFQTLSELSNVFSGRISLHDAEIFNKYAQKSKSPPQTLPRFILYSGHTENLTPLLHALNSPLGMMTPPASSIYFKFYRCPSCKGDLRHQMRVIYKPLASSQL